MRIYIIDNHIAIASYHLHIQIHASYRCFEALDNVNFGELKLFLTNLFNGYLKVNILAKFFASSWGVLNLL